MFKNTFQTGLLTVFHSIGSSPLNIWDTHVQNGHIKRLTDSDVNSLVLEIIGTNVTTTYITCPRDPKMGLGIRLPFMVMIVKNLKRYFSFEVVVMDNKKCRRRFRISNFQTATKIKPFSTTMPIGLSGGWNQIQLNLSDFTSRAYGTQFVEVLRINIHANCRLRRIYYCDRLYTEDELPKDYKLYLPIDKKVIKEKSIHSIKAEEPSVKVSKVSVPFSTLDLPEQEPIEPTAADQEQIEEYEDVATEMRGEENLTREDEVAQAWEETMTEADEGTMEAPDENEVENAEVIEDEQQIEQQQNTEGELQEIQEEVQEVQEEVQAIEEAQPEGQEEPPAEELPAEESPAEEPPAEEPPAEDVLDEEPPADEPPEEAVDEPAEE